MHSTEYNSFQLNRSGLFILLIGFFLFAVSVSVGAADYTVQGEEITFMQQSGIVIFEGSPVFKTADFTLRADKFELDTESKELKAFDNVVLESEQDDLRGESLDYNYETEEGTLYGAEGRVGEMFFSGARLDILSTSPVEGTMQSAVITPCIRKEPHYHLEAKEVRINPDNTITFHHIVPHIANIPVFYLPYYSVTYDPEAENGEKLRDAFPVPQFGYDDRGMTVEFSYPYQIGSKNSGKIYYWKAGSGEERDETREFVNNHQITADLSFKNRYYYLYDYDFEDEELDDEEEEFSTSLLYTPGNLSLETGLLRDLLPEEAVDRYFVDADYRFENGLNTGVRKEYDPEIKDIVKTVYTAGYTFDTGVRASLRREYNREELIKEKYNLSHSQTAVNWNLKYVEGEDYNYYPYLDLSFPAVYSFKASVGTGRVENGGVELNKHRFNLNYNNSWQLPAGFSYHLSHNYRLDHYRSGYDQNYHFSVLNTGFRYRKNLNDKLLLQSGLFYKKDTIRGRSPLPDDREEEERLLNPSLSLDIEGDYPDSVWAIEGDGSYDLEKEEWDEINLRLRKKEDCFDFFIGYEFIDQSINFGLSI
ncbi:LPS-assembly protein [Halanaerobium saccharolyticum]|uniref:LPS-assembly protein n=1 Tax=Halanaerobium saccharolyticum TaxID=43595 RepID=A0A4R7Z879_9FIRM|nr:LPS-assembly protein LptD [Halanaerobium saccharolyticum]RAK09780.1 LPS-assembly protein [Halanaerobium saccharolyticum]TDW07342.1 LPS-assembly protein [Halanaerobium saccharolyticum]TDX61221.1 LPS-assembly protein [Halanaerobium saccharolyticum]